MRIIKKYHNRCLYDTETSGHITLTDLKEYVLQSIPFKVIEAKTKEDVTRAYLIQIILELEGTHSPLFTQDSLEHIIRFYGNPMQNWVRHYLEQFLDMMVKQQSNFEAMQENASSATEGDFMSAFAKLTTKNIALWQELWATTPK